MLGDQLYIASLIGEASSTPVGSTWTLEREMVKRQLSITDAGFDLLQTEIELRMPGQWDKLCATDADRSVYLRLD